MDAADIVTQGTAAAGFAKILVDVVKISPLPASSAALPILAFLFSEGCAFLLAMAHGAQFDRATTAIIVLEGIAATAGAIGLTAAQNKANQ